MLRLILLISGFILMILHQYFPISAQTQFIIFLVGIMLLGVPHGAADLLVAAQTGSDGGKPFSKLNFFSTYLGRLILFALLLWFLPLVGIFSFILFAAYHFGETDLYNFKTNTWSGKLLVCSYGLVILAVILISNVDEVKQLLSLSGSGLKQIHIIDWVKKHQNIALSLFLLLFFSAVFIYFLSGRGTGIIPDKFLLQFAVLVFILYNLPLVLGFSFYFVVWHSTLSLGNIIRYLRKGSKYSNFFILKQIGLYSSIAFAGIFLFGIAGFMFISNQAIMVYIFAGLAILTAPHMPIMHNMYNKLRGS